MINTQLTSDFASPERTDEDVLRWEINYFEKMDGLVYFLDAVPNIVTVLNKNRQIIFANKAFVEALNLPSPSSLYGKRPGEALDCIYAYKNDSGCGTSNFCRNCQAVQSIISCLDGTISTTECTILRSGGKGAIELRVNSHPFRVNGSKYVVFSVIDISHEKRRRILERSFFHDIANSLTGVQGYAEILQMQDLGNSNEWVKKMMLCVQEAVDELFSQKSILAAEDGELIVQKIAINSAYLLKSVKSMFDSKNSSTNSENLIIINKNSENIEFISDRTLVSRVLINMVKNALEASNSEPVKIGSYKTNEGNISFRVSNTCYIPEEIQSHIFKRSFSTKGKGRGLGTYSIKFLTERYLHGKAFFISDKLEGTTFFVDLPIDI
ncbi:MAG TPA: ATP-binding protein [bacterium]|nr:ATP-binding protein [bacterium]HPS30227.1 ATP-binding protein [bacterium]